MFIPVRQKRCHGEHAASTFCCFGICLMYHFHCAALSLLTESDNLLVSVVCHQRQVCPSTMQHQSIYLFHADQVVLICVE